LRPQVSFWPFRPDLTRGRGGIDPPDRSPAVGGFPRFLSPKPPVRGQDLLFRFAPAPAIRIDVPVARKLPFPANRAAKQAI
jgi:hypothetical protein